MTGKRLPDDSMTTAALFLDGARRSIPVILTAGPFGALFGAVAVENGLSIFEAVMMSITIFAGASQLVGIELFGQQIPAWIVILSIFAVNFRHVLYSASIGRHIGHWSGMRQAIAFFFLVDPAYAEAEQRVEQGGSVQFAWYWGLVLPTYVGWNVMTWLGAIFGNFLQDSQKWGIDYILPIYFMGLVLGFRKRSFWFPVVAVSALASVIAKETIGSPWHVSAGALAGIVLAAFFAPTASGDDSANNSIDGHSDLSGRQGEGASQ